MVKCLFNIFNKNRHIHKYTDVLIKYICIIDKTVTYSKGIECKKCGMVMDNYIMEAEKIPNTQLSRMLTEEEILEKYKDLKIVERMW